MDAPGTVPESINCHECNAPIDLAGQQAFTQVECARCGALSVVPLKFASFLLLQTLGVGGVGTVYKALDLSLHRYLAIKILRKKLASDPHFIENFAREARAAASVNHPNVAHVYSFGEHEGQYYLAMELLERGSLDDWITQHGRVPEADVLAIGAQIAGGLHAAQQRGLLHRDIKPGNIQFNDEGVPKLVDFGLARAQHEASEDAGTQTVWGTPYYIAPETLRGRPEDFRSDMYSLGATMFHALAGRPPFDAATTREVVTQHATTPALSLKTFAPDLQQSTAAVIGRMLAKEPGERYDSYDALIHDLQEAQRRLRQGAPEPSPAPEIRPRRPLWPVIAGAAAVAGCAIAVWLFVRSRAPHAVPPPVAPATVADAVDFESEEAWAKSWRVATRELARGSFNDAILGYDGALYQAGRDRPRTRQWIRFFEAIALAASGQPDDAHKLLAEKARDPAADARVTPPVSVANFIQPLAGLWLGETAADDRETELPGWAKGLAHLTLGFRHLDAGQIEAARDEFRAYRELPLDETQRWAFELQPLAWRLADGCDETLRGLAQVEALEAAGKPATALELARTLKSGATLPAFRAAFEQREARLQNAIEERHRQAAREKDEQEARQRLHALDETAAAAAATYDFAAMLARYDAANFDAASEAIRQEFEQRKARARLLVEFKTQLARDIPRRPYESAGLPTRGGLQLVGRLTRATDTELVFANPYGELMAKWSDLAPATLMQLAEWYASGFASSEPPATQARRYLTLAAFARQFGSERAAAYWKRAMQLAPGIGADIEHAFGADAARMTGE
jgi:hypothetical protein